MQRESRSFKVDFQKDDAWNDQEFKGFDLTHGIQCKLHQKMLYHERNMYAKN